MLEKYRKILADNNNFIVLDSAEEESCVYSNVEITERFHDNGIVTIRIKGILFGNLDKNNDFTYEIRNDHQMIMLSLEKDFEEKWNKKLSFIEKEKSDGANYLREKLSEFDLLINKKPDQN